MTAVGDVVLIHSTGQGAAGWDRVVRALGDRGQTAHAVELPSAPQLLAADYAERIRRSPAIMSRSEVPRRTSELLVPTMVAGTSLNVARSKQLTAGHNPRDKTNMSYG